MTIEEVWAEARRAFLQTGDAAAAVEVLRQHLVPRPTGEVGESVRWLKLIASKLMGRMAVDGVGVNATCDQAAAHLTALSATKTSLLSAGNKVYEAAYHGGECPMNTTGARCTCGFDDAADAWTAAVKEAS